MNVFVTILAEVYRRCGCFACDLCLIISQIFRPGQDYTARK